MKYPAVIGTIVLAACSTGKPADLVLRNGTVHADAGDTTTVEALAIRDGLIVFLGTSAEAEALIGSGTRVIELEGRMVLPGFHDTHVHPRYGTGLAEVVLEDAGTPEAILDSVRRYAARHPDKAWIRGRGWQLPVFPQANPRREWLDAIVPDRPVYLTAADGHSSWVNSRALEIAGVTSATPDPPNGRIERDAGGAPSGTLRESASELVGRHLPRQTVAELREGIQQALAMANRFGITSVHDANADPAVLEAYAALDRENLLTARVFAALDTDPRAGPGQVDSLRAWRGRYPGTRFYAPSAAKIFVDGVIEARTAALLAPYTGTNDSGPANLTPGAMDSLVSAIDAAGFQVHVHAIGDRAVRQALDALAYARRHNGPRDARPVIAHLELIDPADVPRFAELGVVPSFQPLWAQRDTYITDLTEPVLGPERSRRLYPIGSVARSGARLAAGSDWTVSSMNPLEGIQVAITRRSIDSAPGPAWLPEELVELAVMLRAYTSGGAWTAGNEARTGTLEVGKAADLIVLDRDLYRIPAAEIHAVRVLLTMLEGRQVWKDQSLP
jgi:predicted amidohydrolase YtcJ